MAYVALYRKWRPEKFSDLVGQEHISRTLASAIRSGRIGHAYLFSGPRGTGKTSTAKILARALNCEEGPTPEPCGHCQACQKIADGTSVDVFEIDAASNRGIDEIRDLRETVNFAPNGRYRVYIIDEVHMLTQEAFNALLKTLEEPPAHVVFILATTEAHKVPATIQSRCQRYDFRRITAREIEDRLRTVTNQMGIAAEDEALSLIALQADGGLRDALSILDQCMALAEGNIDAERVRKILGLVGHGWIYRLTEDIGGKNAQGILKLLSELLQEGKDLKQILLELSLHFRSLMIYKAAGALGSLDLYEEEKETLSHQAKLFSTETLMQMIGKLHEALNEIKWSPQPRITAEVTLLSFLEGGAAVAAAPVAPSAAQTADDGRLASLEAKIMELSRALESGVKTKAAPPSAAEKPKNTPQRGKAPVRRPVEAVSDAAGDPDKTAEGQELWQRFLDTLKAQANGKNHSPEFACFSQGRFAGLSNSSLYVTFKIPFMASRANKNYKSASEEILSGLAGRPLALVARGEGEPWGPRGGTPTQEKKAPEKKEVTVSLERKEPALAKAMDVFGDDMTKV